MPIAAGGTANYGGNYVPSLPIFIDPNSLIIEMLDEVDEDKLKLVYKVLSVMI